MNISIIEHKENGQIIHQRIQDGYVNATALCKTAGKLWGHYYENKTTKEFLGELSSVIGIPITALVCTIQGGEPELQGTYIHPQVAINLGQWLSPKFAVKVSKWVSDWINRKPSISIPNFASPYEAALAWAEAYKEKEIAQAERDYVIKTKAWIGEKREATAMATASTERRRANKLADELGEGKNFKAVKAIPWLSKYFYLEKSGCYSQIGIKLKNYCMNNGYEFRKIESSQYPDGIFIYHIKGIESFRVHLDYNPEILMRYRKLY